MAYKTIINMLLHWFDYYFYYAVLKKINWIFLLSYNQVEALWYAYIAKKLEYKIKKSYKIKRNDL